MNVKAKKGGSSMHLYLAFFPVFLARIIQQYHHFDVFENWSDDDVGKKYYTIIYLLVVKYAAIWTNKSLLTEAICPQGQ